MRHLDLFAGLGGFSFALDCVWYDEKNEHTFVEWEPFPQAVLRKHWPDAEIHGDIRAFVTDAARRRRERREIPARQRAKRKGTPDLDRFDIVTGGFPCQPFSAAGRRKGTADDRYLWPPMLEAIAIFKPRWVIAENVRGLASWNDGLVLETVCTDLENEGYEVWPLVIPAASVGAPHKRERVWIIAHAISINQGSRAPGQDASAQREVRQRDEMERIAEPDSDATDAECAGLQEREAQHTSQLQRPIGGNRERDVTDTQSKRRRKGTRQGATKRTGAAYSSDGRDSWSEDWPTVATRLCAMDDGLPNGLVRPRGWRNAALKAAGNAIVPQVAIQIMLAIRHADVIHSDPSPTSGSSV